jgi:hypothetical protein
MSTTERDALLGRAVRAGVIAESERAVWAGAYNADRRGVATALNAGLRSGSRVNTAGGRLVTSSAPPAVARGTVAAALATSPRRGTGRRASTGVRLVAADNPERDAAVEAAIREGRIADSPTSRTAWREAWDLDEPGTRRLLRAAPEEGGLVAPPARASLNALTGGEEPTGWFVNPQPGSVHGGEAQQPASAAPPAGESGEGTGWWNRPTLLGGDTVSHLRPAFTHLPGSVREGES